MLLTVQAKLHHPLCHQPQRLRKCLVRYATSCGDVSRCASACGDANDVAISSDCRCSRYNHHRSLSASIATSTSNPNRDAANAACYAVTRTHNLARSVCDSLVVPSTTAQAVERSCCSGMLVEGRYTVLLVLAGSHPARVSARSAANCQSCLVAGCNYAAIAPAQGKVVGRNHVAVAEVSTDTVVRVAPGVGGSFGNTRLLPLLCSFKEAGCRVYWSWM